MSRLYHWVLRLLRIEPTFTRYTFVRGQPYLPTSHVSVITVHRNGKVFRTFDTGDRAKLEFVRSLMVGVLGSTIAGGLLAGRVVSATVLTTKKIFKPKEKAMRTSFARHDPPAPFGGTFCSYKDEVGSEFYRTFLSSDSADDFVVNIRDEYDTRVEYNVNDRSVRVYYTKKTAPKLAS